MTNHERNPYEAVNKPGRFRRAARQILSVATGYGAQKIAEAPSRDATNIEKISNGLVTIFSLPSVQEHNGLVFRAKHAPPIRAQKELSWALEAQGYDAETDAIYISPFLPDGKARTTWNILKANRVPTRFERTLDPHKPREFPPAPPLPPNGHMYAFLHRANPKLGEEPYEPFLVGVYGSHELCTVTNHMSLGTIALNVIETVSAVDVAEQNNSLQLLADMVTTDVETLQTLSRH